MSYDIWLEDDNTNCSESHNYTYNISPMLELAGCLMRDIEGLTGLEASKKLRIAISAMTLNPDRFQALNPPNGWGSFRGCLNWLLDILEDCKQYPTWRVHVG